MSMDTDDAECEFTSKISHLLTEKYCCIDECRIGVSLSGIMCTRHDSYE
jgi:hypothetical protein